MAAHRVSWEITRRRNLRLAWDTSRNSCCSRRFTGSEPTKEVAETMLRANLHHAQQILGHEPFMRICGGHFKSYTHYVPYIRVLPNTVGYCWPAKTLIIVTWQLSKSPIIAIRNIITYYSGQLQFCCCCWSYLFSKHYLKKHTLWRVKVSMYIMHIWHCTNIHDYTCVCVCMISKSLKWRCLASMSSLKFEALSMTIATRPRPGHSGWLRQNGSGDRESSCIWQSSTRKPMC